jgi:hypothetical protein
MFMLKATGKPYANLTTLSPFAWYTHGGHLTLVTRRRHLGGFGSFRERKRSARKDRRRFMDVSLFASIGPAGACLICKE